LVGQVWSVERIKPLQDKARQRLRLLGLRNVHLQHADGGLGWPDDSKQFNGIITTAAPRDVPDSLRRQLAPDGVLVIPVGVDTQYLTMIIRVGDSDEFRTEKLEPVRFVPLLSGTTR